MPDLDLSELHDLLHPIGSDECRATPGGWRRHLEMKWDYEWLMPQALWNRPLHVLGRHVWTEVWDFVPGEGWGRLEKRPDRVICIYCPAEKVG